MSRILTCLPEEFDMNLFNDPRKLEKELFDEERYRNKPAGGLYGSTYKPNEYYKSSWLRYVFEDGYRCGEYLSGFSYTLHKNTKICEIDSFSDLKNLLETYSEIYCMATNSSELSDRERLLLTKKTINFYKLSRDYDAFHVTEKAAWNMHDPFNFRMKDDNGIQICNFYNYDVETWIIFNLDCINKGSIMNHKFQNLSEW